MTRNIPLVAAVVLGCRVPDDVASDTGDEITESRSTGILCRRDAESCFEEMYLEITSRVGARACERDAGPDERCVAGFVSLYTIGSGAHVCRLAFWVDELMVPMDAFTPNSEYPEVGFRVRLTDSSYELRLTESFTIMVNEGCEGAEAAALVSEGHLDEVIYTLDLEPSDVHYTEPLQHRDERDDNVGVQPHPVYKAVLELRTGDVRLRIPTRSLWTPVGGPDQLSQRTGDEWVWDILWIGPTSDVRPR